MFADTRVPLRFEFDDAGVTGPATATAASPEASSVLVSTANPHPATPDGSRGDLAMVEDLLDRCWREVDAAALNVKLADIVRLLEFKNKLRSAADAEQTFWSMIHDMRREELNRFGDITRIPDPPDQPADDEGELLQKPLNCGSSNTPL